MKDVKIKCNSVEEADAVLQMIEDRYPEVRWYSGDKPTRWKPYGSDTKGDAEIYFGINDDRISYDISTDEWHKDCDWTNATSAKRFLRKSNTAIHIYQRGRMVIAHESQTGREAVAKCSPDDKFNFHTGASIALARLMSKVPATGVLNPDVRAEWTKLLGITETPTKVYTDADRNFNVGDRVVVRDWDDMAKEYGEDSWENIPKDSHFTRTMNHLCGRTATVTYVEDGFSYKKVKVDFDDKSGMTSWTFNPWMFNRLTEETKKTPLFKVGDMVTLKPNLETDKRYGTVTLLSGEMTDKVNHRPSEVVFVDPDSHTDVIYCLKNGYHYSEEMLEKWDESKIHEGDTVKVVNTGLNYSSYVQWVGEHISDPYMAARFCFGSPSLDEKYKVIKIAEHEKNHRPLAYIEQIDGIGFNKCYLIEVKGLEKA